MTFVCALFTNFDVPCIFAANVSANNSSLSNVVNEKNATGLTARANLVAYVIHELRCTK